MIQACRQVFTSSLNLICFIHVRRNISAKIQELKINEGTKKMILDDIFGRSTGTHHTEGLVDTLSESMFDQLLEELSKKWIRLDSSA